MKYFLNSISYKVRILLPSPDSYKDLGKTDLVFVLPSDPRKWSKSRVKHVQWKYLMRFIGNYDKIKWETVEIENSKFSLELIQCNNDYEFPDYGMEFYPVRLHHPQLDLYPFPIITYVKAKTLLRLISKSEFISNNRIHGTFCCSHVDGLSGIWCTTFDIENPEDEILNKQKEFGKRLSSEKKTTKWIPGYTYYLVNGKKVLYIGQLSNIPDISCIKVFDKSTGGYSIATNIFRSGTISKFGVKKDGHLFIYLDDDIGTYIDGLGSEQSISNVLISALHYSSNNGGEYELQKCYKFYYNKPKPGLQGEKKFLDDTKLVDLNKIVGNFLANFYNPRITEINSQFPICSEYNSFDDQLKKILKEKL